MPGKLSSINIKSSGGSPKASTPTSTVQTRYAQSPGYLQNPDIQFIRSITNMEPFIIPELIPDLIYMMKYEGIKSITDDYEMIQIFEAFGFETFVAKYLEKFDVDQETLITTIYNSGGTILMNKALEADPKNPKSIMFILPFQDVNAKTQEIEYTIKYKDPEIPVNATVSCKYGCSGKRVKTISVQMRRADEAATVVAYCGECRKQWRFSSA
jgi:DNA-directed RNA polymerase subunit M/transcription elongation factor TFIIS